MRLEVIHCRDPDAPCGIMVFIDGERVRSFDEYGCDPGAGYFRSEWDETTAAMVAEASPEVARLVRALRDEAAEYSPYIDDDREAANVWPYVGPPAAEAEEDLPDG